MNIPEQSNPPQDAPDGVQRWTLTPAGRRYLAVHRLTGVWPDHLPAPQPVEVQRWTAGPGDPPLFFDAVPAWLERLMARPDADRATLEEWISWIAEEATGPDPAP